MNDNNFNISVESIEKISIIYVSGYLDAHTAPVLESKLESLVQSDNYYLVVNFRELNYISSAGLGVFMGFIEECRDHGGDIKLCEMQDNVYTIFDLLGFPLLFDISKSMKDSIDKFEKNDE